MSDAAAAPAPEPASAKTGRPRATLDDYWRLALREKEELDTWEGYVNSIGRVLTEGQQAERAHWTSLMTLLDMMMQDRQAIEAIMKARLAGTPAKVEIGATEIRITVRTKGPAPKNGSSAT